MVRNGMDIKKPLLVFVYNADSGLFNTLADMAHKLFSPKTYECQLCMLTHTVLHEKKDWREFIGSLGVETRFLHRDQLSGQYADPAVEMPAIFIDQGGQLQELVSAVEIRGCETLEALQDLVKTRIQSL